MKIHLIISVLVLIIELLPYSTFGQCDSLKNWSDINLTEHLKYGPEKWKKSYYDYFHSDSGDRLITADSVLISYLRHPENQTNFGMPCSYFLATSYAENELNRLIEVLNKNLGEVDSMNFEKSQAAWLDFYQREREFIKHAFVGYANYSKYGHGREIMIDNAARIYDFIKNRILDVKYYIEVSDYQEEKK
jgi:hypothetical protein